MVVGGGGWTTGCSRTVMASILAFAVEAESCALALMVLCMSESVAAE